MSVQTLTNMLLVLMAAVLGGLLWFGDLVRLSGIKVSGSVLLGRDFVNVWLGGVLARTGQIDTIYDIHRYMAELQARLGIDDLYAYSYPPHSLLLASVFSLFPYAIALTLWTLAGLALFYHAARPYLATAGVPAALALILPAGLVNIWAGHYGFLIGALALYGWRLLDSRPALAGVMFGIMTIKPHLGLVVALVLLVQGRWQAIAAAAATASGLALLSGLCFGFDLWPQYIFHTLGFHAGLLTGKTAAFHGMMPTTTAALLQLGAGPPYLNMAQALSAVYAIAIVLIAVRQRVSTMDLGLIASTAIFLILPYAFNYDMTIVSLAIVVAAARSGPTADIGTRILLGAGYLLPLLLVPGQHVIFFGPLVLAGVLWVQLRIAVARAPANMTTALPAVAATEQAQA